MTRTPDEIKKGLECKKRVFADSCYDKCATCELFIPCYGTVERCADALALIRWHEEKNEAMHAEIVQLQAERDAAVESMRSDPHCCYHCANMTKRGICQSEPRADGHCFEWRGVQKEESDDGEE